MTWLLTIGLVNAVLAAGLAVVAFAVGHWTRRPALAHLLWLLVLAKLLTPPVVEVPVGWQIDPSLFAESPLDRGRESLAATASPFESPHHRQRLPTPSHDATHRAGSGDDLDAPAVDLAASPPAWHALLSPVLWLRTAAAVWLIGSAAVLLLFAVRAIRFQRYLQRSGRSDEELAQRVARLARSAELTSHPQVVVVETVISPLLWGIGRNLRLVFPAELARQLHRPACDALLLHELAHYSRKDHWVRLLELAAQVVFWWHPVVWLARREIETAEEACCDAWVVERHTAARRTYAEALLATIDFLSHQPALLPPAACGLGDGPVLRQRLTQIMRGEVDAGLHPAVRVVVLCLAALILPLGPALFAASERSRLPDEVQTFEIEPVPMTTAPLVLAPLPPAAQRADSELPRATPARTDVTANLVAAAAVRRQRAELWATATSPDGRFRIEARSGGQTTLVTQPANWRLDLSSHGIVSVAFTPDSRRFVTGHDDGLVRIWDSQSGGLLGSLRGSSASITSLAVSPDGRRAAAGAKDGSAIVWQLDTGDELARLPRDDAPVSCLRWSAAGDRLAVALGEFSDQGAAEWIVWSPDERAIDGPFAAAEPIAAVGWLDGDRALLVAAWDGTLVLHDPRDGRPLVQVEMGTSAKAAVSAAWWSPDCPLAPAWLVEQLLAWRDR